MTTWKREAESPSTLALLALSREEFRRHKLAVIGAFSLIALIALALGLFLPKKYTSNTTILVEEGNIIAPLMEGRAVPTGVTNRAIIAKEVAFSRKVLQEILKVGGWMQGNPDALAQDRLMERITGRTQITNPRENLIEISYTDNDPTRAYEVTRRFGDLVIQESLSTKERESREAYEFIDTQVNAYHRKLTSAESKLEAFRRANPDARPGVDADVNTRIGELRRQVENSRMDLLELRSQEGALEAQLSGESEISAVQTREGQLRARVAELQAERDRLLLNFTAQHPDVVRVQHQLTDLDEELRREDNRRDKRLADMPGVLDDSSAMNPLYAELRSKLAEARRRTGATAARVANGESLLAGELARSGRIASSESSLSELTRDYEVNRDLYQDLLKRRENARVSMNLDAEQRGLSFRIQEPAVLPLQHSGIRLMYISAAGLLLATVIPLLALLGKLRMDPRVRSAADIERKAGLPVLGTIPLMLTGAQRTQSMRGNIIGAFMVLTVLGAYGLTLILKLVDVL